MTHVGVIGAGWSGLAAGAELAAAGCSVTLFEASRNLGGRARRVRIDGVDLDNGQHILLGAYRETLRLIRMVGGDEHTLLMRLPLELVYPGQFSMRAPAGLPAPLNLLIALLGARGFDWRDKWSAIRLLRFLKGSRFAFRPDLSVASLLVAQRQSARANMFLWEPLCIAALNTAPAEASASVFGAVLRDAFTGVRSDSDLLVPRVDLSRLFPEPAAAFICGHGGSILLGEAVNVAECDETGVRLHCGGKSHRFDAAICAVPPYRAAAILNPGKPSSTHLHEQLNAFEYEPIVTCYLQYPPEVRLPRPMIGMTAKLSQWAFDRGAFGGSAGMIAVVVSAAGRLLGLDSATLAATIHAELAGCLPGLAPPRAHRVITEKRATFRSAPGLARPTTNTVHSRIALAGDHTMEGYPATIESAVRSGVAAARAILRLQAAGLEQAPRA